jgi:hypothetical protein
MKKASGPQQRSGKIGPVNGGGGIKAVYGYPVAAGKTGGVDVTAVIQVHGHVTGEKQQVAPFYVRAGDLADGVALPDLRVPPMITPLSRYAMKVSRKQSMPSGVLPPHRYWAPM